MTFSGELTRRTQTTAVRATRMIECTIGTEEGEIKIPVQRSGIVGVGGKLANQRMRGKISTAVQVGGGVGIRGSFCYCGNRKYIFGTGLQATNRGGCYIACE